MPRFKFEIKPDVVQMTRVTKNDKVMSSIRVKRDEVPSSVMDKLSNMIDIQYPSRDTFSFVGELMVSRVSNEAQFYKQTLSNLV